MQAWNVYLGDILIDTVYYESWITKDEVRRSLINHDGFDFEIEIREAD